MEGVETMVLSALSHLPGAIVDAWPSSTGHVVAVLRVDPTRGGLESWGAAEGYTWAAVGALPGTVDAEVIYSTQVWAAARDAADAASRVLGPAEERSCDGCPVVATARVIAALHHARLERLWAAIHGLPAEPWTSVQSRVMEQVQPPLPVAVWLWRQAPIG